ncbi:VWA domain-containing protein [Vibrio furnissii]|uniref:vWA domain-containing protein n=1 Tax=Vibrio furnissii TaxID=29494 RepID=UPI001EEBDAFA|nr:VWA domain-containing protein [Vibrio furnissii]MCG6211189.1 VWA domain-containing protein [Vibrio furnissii]
MSDFVFLSPQWFWALIPLGGLVLWLSRRSKNQTLIAPHLATALGLASPKNQRGALHLIALGWLIAVTALADPSFETQPRPSYSANNARVVVMDMSLSLHATDIKPNRLAQARYKVLDLLKGWPEGSTGLVAYAGDAYTVSPLTSDSATIANLVPNLSPEIMPFPGANAATGVQRAIEMLKNAGLNRGDIILLADDLDASESKAIRALLEGTQWKLMIVGIGTQAGAPILLDDGSLLKTDAGQTVVARTDFATMQSLASAVNGVFTPYRADGSDVERILAETRSEHPVTGSKNAQTIRDHVNQGYWLVLILLVPALLLFRRGFVFVALLGVTFGLHAPTAEASPWLNRDQQAMQAFEQKDYQHAAEQFTDPQWQGIARYEAKDYQGAIDAFSQVATPDSRTQYNLANAYAQAGQLEQARDRYQQLLQTDPDNADAKHNLQVVEQALKQQQQQQQQQQQKSSQGSEQKPNPSSSNGDQSTDAQNSSSQTAKDEQNPSQSSNQSSNQSAQNSDSANPSEAQANSQQNPQNAPERSQGQNSKSQHGEQNTPKGSQAKADHEQPTQASQAQAQAQAESAPASDPHAPPPTDVATQAQPTTQSVDPQLRKLEQVESARDPSQLLRAQLYLQAQDREPPQTQGKKW